MSSAVSYYFEDQELVAVVIGLILAIATAAVIFGGVHRIGIISSTVSADYGVVVYHIGTLYHLGKCAEITCHFGMIMEQAFDLKAIMGGLPVLV